MRDTTYCRAGKIRCLYHIVYIPATSEEWDCCNKLGSHTCNFERCPIPSCQKEVEILKEE